MTSEACKSNVVVPKDLDTSPHATADWETDPNWVNDVSEKNQRWGSKSNGVLSKSDKADLVDIADLRKKAVQAHQDTSLKEWLEKKGTGVKESYGVKLYDKK
ncbi:hypothetical protein SeMB42_g06319 [Synchytrium endobioticum]|uniref:Uncharacterized protein n=1 Tax=Synchytrium endobioticum TaxID=286115 RepID=A0A507CIQ8_9FUNG|nr:hypothetical protein SeMB42_g06319 [Synchytrium endobioticum]TPX47070.1 hypothetical protein SeLEV6574_g02867 [Synchytrium endobioticum]